MQQPQRDCYVVGDGALCLFIVQLHFINRLIIAVKIFGKNFENSKWLPFLKKFSKVSLVYSLDTMGVENYDEIALSPTVKEIEAILCFATFGKN